MRPQDAVDLTRKLAEEQHGVVARRQLLALGLSREQIGRWRAAGRLAVQHRGVYSVGHALLSVEGRWMAAVLACGPRAALSHRSAATLWGLRPPGAAAIDVTVPPDGPRKAGDGIRTHRAPLGDDGVVTTEQGIRVTTVPRTLLDLAASAPRHVLRRAMETADRLELLDVRALQRVLVAHPGRPGSPALRAVLADMERHGITLTRSDVEAAFLQICLDHGLPRPQVNHYDNGVEVDFRWPSHRLIVEVDGWAYHRGRAAFAADRARDRRALADGWRVARFTATEVLRSMQTVAGELSDLLLTDVRQPGVE